MYKFREKEHSLLDRIFFFTLESKLNKKKYENNGYLKLHESFYWTKIIKYKTLYYIQFKNNKNCYDKFYVITI